MQHLSGISTNSTILRFVADLLDSKSYNTHKVNLVSYWTPYVPAKWHRNPSNGLSKVNECNRRQTDHGKKKCIAICGFVCATFAVDILICGKLVVGYNL